MDTMTLALTSLLAVAAPASVAETPTTDIKVSQVGYPTRAPKLVLVSAATPAKGFSVKRAGDGALVLEGKLSEPVLDADTGDRVQAADLTALSKPGRYFVFVPGVGRSFEFPVGPNVFTRPLYLAMRSFYGQRCGTAVDLGPEYPGYRYPACHLEGAFHASSGKAGPRVSAKGWHDAGDYGRYIVNSGITTGSLLWAFELFSPRLEKLKLDIPESGGRLPDVLAEIRWNLDWMLSLQDQDGGVWPKQTSESFVGFVMPQDDKTTSYVIGTGQEPYKTSCATADFAAVMAIAARVYRRYDPAYAERTREAARHAWTWVVAHPSVSFENPPGVRTGSYGDARCGDELLWAAAELWRTSGDEAAQRYFLDHQGELRSAVKPDDPPAWPNVAPLALWSYTLAAKRDRAVQAGIRKDSLAAADAIVARTAANAYRVSLTTRQYGWGSNGIAANYGLQLLVANTMRRDPRYLETARDNLYYLLGRNTFSLSWVTRVGANPVRRPHHRPSAADAHEEPWPGLLAGGPNQTRQDAAMRRLPEGLPPAKMYVDDQTSYATNENAINWNAALVFALAGAED
jgi:endoglucanase